MKQIIPKLIIGIIVTTTVFGCLGLISFFLWSPSVLADFEDALTRQKKNTVLRDAQGQPFRIIDGVEDRRVVPLNEISRFLQLSVLAAEDLRFLQHRGIDAIRIVGAFIANLESGRYKQGGSTLTQQLIKLSLLTPEKSLSRKVKEIFMAMALEQHLSKQEILEHYLNTIYLGHGNYGVEQAAQRYFDKPSSKLNLAESAFLAGIIQKPTSYLKLPSHIRRAEYDYFPRNLLQHAIQRQHYVLGQLLTQGWISAQHYKQALQETLQVQIPSSAKEPAPYFTQHVLSELKVKHHLPHVSTGGYQVTTTIDPQVQAIAESIREQAFDKFPNRFSQIAMIVLDAQSNQIRAMIGGRNFSESQFNRATQAKRQPGSTFKTFIYATAFDQGLHPGSIMTDEALYYETKEPDGTLSAYSPRNFDRLYGAERPFYNQSREAYYEDTMTLEMALVHSINTIAVQTLYEVGLESLHDYTDQLGISISPEAGLCVALGCAEVSLLDLAAAHFPFINQGFYQPPHAILQIEDSSGNLIYKNDSTVAAAVFSEETAYQMKELLHGVVTRGTGRRANWKGNQHFIAGKTGTNSEYRDAWFVGFSPELITGVWIGHDNNAPMKHETGGHIPALLWSQFMQQALSVIPSASFVETRHYHRIPTCRVSGKRATDTCPSVASYPYSDPRHLSEEACDYHPGTLIEPQGDMDRGSFRANLQSSFTR